MDVDSNGERALANAFVELRAEGTPVAFHEVPIASPAVVLMHLAGGVMVEVPANGEGARFVAAVATHAASTRASCS
ncbi:MAG: hypothetical protein FJ144_28490 [Deltaproteobacteria bacterium]|nr:hypothetical protein [Deltaproteobacteria bacterium]